MEKVPNQIATAHLLRGLLAPRQARTPRRAFLSFLRRRFSPEQRSPLLKNRAFKSEVFPSLVQIVFPQASFCLGVGCEDVKAQSGFVVEESFAAPGRWGSALCK